MRHPVNDLFPIMGDESAWKKAFEAYLDDGGDVNHHNVFLSSPHLGKTLLIRAIELNSLPIVKRLLECKANPNIPHSKTLQTPYSYLLSNPSPDDDTTSISKSLLDHSLDVNKVDEFTYMSPLYHILSTPITYNRQHALIARQLLAKNAITAFKSHPDYVIGEQTSLDTPRTIVLHQNPAFVILSNDSQPLTHDYYAIIQFLIKKAREKTYIQLFNFFPGDKSARTLDKYSDCTLFQHLVMCNNRVYPFTPLTYLFTKHCKKLPPQDLVQYVLENSDASLHPDAKFLSAIEKMYKESIADSKILTHSRPNAPGVLKEKAAQGNSAQARVVPDPRLVYQTYCDLGFTALNDILSHPSQYDDNTLHLIHLSFASDSFKNHYKRWVYYEDAYVSGYFDYKAVEHYKKTKATMSDGSYQILLHDPAHEEKYSLPNRVIINPNGEPEYITDVDSDQELFVVELNSDPFFINVNKMCQSYYEQAGSQRNNIQLLQAHLHHGAFYKGALFFPNGVGENAMVFGPNTANPTARHEDDDEDETTKKNPDGLVHRQFDEYFTTIYELLLSHTVSLHLTKEQLEVGRELMAAQDDAGSDDEKDKKKKKSDKRRDKSILNHGDTKHSTEHHNYMYRASGALLLSIRGRTRPNVDFIEYLIHVHHATTTISMYSFHNVFLWLLSSCQDLDLEKFRYTLSLLLDEAGCDVLSVKYQQRMHQLTQKPLSPEPNGQGYGIGAETSLTEGSRLGSVTRNHSASNQPGSRHYDPHSIHHQSNLSTPAGSHTNHPEESVSKKGSRSFFSRFTSIFQAGPSALVTKTLARQYSFDYFSLVLLFCLTSPKTTTYLYIFTLMTTLYERLVTHQSQLSMSLVISREAFRSFNRDHFHSHVIEYNPLFNSEGSLLNDKKHVANTILLYFMAYGNLRLRGSNQVYAFLIKHQPFKASSYSALMKCFLTLHGEQYLFEYKDNQHHHNKSYLTQYHQDITKSKIQRFGQRAVELDTQTSNSSSKNHDFNEDEEERLMLDLQINPKLLITPRSPLFTEAGSQFFELLFPEYWQQEVRSLRTQYPYDESALTDNNNNKNQQYNEQFTVMITIVLTNIVNNTIFSPQDGIWLYKVIDKFLTSARADILSHRQELDCKWAATAAAAIAAAQEQRKVVNLDGLEHSTDLSLFTHNKKGANYAYHVDCTRLFHTPIPVSTDLVRALTSLLAEQYHIVLVYYQQYFNCVALSPYAYHISHSVLEVPATEELSLIVPESNDNALGLSSNAAQTYHNVIIIDDEENEAEKDSSSTSAGKGTPTQPTRSLKDKQQASKEAVEEGVESVQAAAHSKSVLVGGHYGRFSLASNPRQKPIEYDPASIDSIIATTYASTIDQIEAATEHLQILRKKKIESFMRYRGCLPAIYGLLRATSQQAITPTWFQLFDLLVGECKDIFQIAKLTRTSPLSLFLFSCLVLDSNSLAVSKWLLQPPISAQPQKDASDEGGSPQADDGNSRPKLTKVSDFMHTQLCPPPPAQRFSVTSHEYQQRENELTKASENQHFDYVEALYSLVTAPAHRHNQVYKSLLEKMLLFIHPDDLNLFSFDPNSVLTHQEHQQQQLTYQAMFQQFNMNKSIVSQYLSHLASPTQMSIDILHLLIRAGGKVHLANPTTNQSPLIYFVQQQTHQQNITQEFFQIFQLLFQNYGHCGVLLLTTEHRTLFELALTHVRVIDDICVEYFLLLLSSSHVAYRHALGYQDVMEELALLERNKNKRLMAPVLAVDRVDGLWSKTHKLIDSAWVEPTGHTLFGQYTKDKEAPAGTTNHLTSGHLRRSFVPSRLTREEFSTLFDFYYSTMYLAPNARYYSVVHALANHRDQHIVATIFGNVPNHESYLYYASSTRDVTLKEIIIQALTQRRKELNNTTHFTINLEIVDCIDNVEPIQVEEVPQKQGKGKQAGNIFQRQQQDSATPSTAPAIPEWATALSDTMHLNFSRKRQQRTVRDGTEGLLWFIINGVQNPRTEDLITLLDGAKDDNGQLLSTPVSADHVNFNNETTLMHAILRRWNQDLLIFMIKKIGIEKVLKDRDNNGRTAYDYMVAVCTHLYAPEAVKLLADARK